MAVASSAPAAGLGQVPPAAAQGASEPAPASDVAAGGGGLPRGGAADTLAAGGAVLGGLGMLAMLAAGISWITAASNAARLDTECPQNICYEGTPGGDALETARDAEVAASVLTGVGMPLLAGGLVLVVFSRSLSSSEPPVRALPAVGQGFAGGAILGRF
jgi:hypothetical protein